MAKDIAFPLFKTKIEDNKKFDLNDPQERKKYFKYKAGDEIKKLRSYLEDNGFIAYLLGKKSSGKGTYSKMIKEVVAPDKIEHFSIGDMIRDVDKELQDPEKKKELISYLEENYRGFTPLDKIIKSLEERDTESLLPTELILTLVKREISENEQKGLFIDGFPRNMDQVSFSLFFRDLVGYREERDLFVLIDVPEKVIDERIKYRRVCPKCNTSRNLKLFPTEKVGYDKKSNDFYLICDNDGERMVRKEGDEKGIGPIKERIKKDRKIIKKTFSMHGIPKVLLRNSVPVEKAKEYIDDYEITPKYEYEWNKQNEEVEVKETPWKVEDDRGVKSYSLMAPPVVVSFIKQLVEKLDL